MHRKLHARPSAAHLDRRDRPRRPSRSDRYDRYDRARDLPLLLPIWPAELADTSAEGRKRLITLLRRALRAERARGLGGHWSYDLSRHAQLRAALDAELARAEPRPQATPKCKKARCRAGPDRS